MRRWCRMGGRRASLLLLALALTAAMLLLLLASDLSPRRRAPPRRPGAPVDPGGPPVSFAGPAPRAVAPGAPTLVVHVDLKGSPPTLPFFKQFLRLAAELGADGLLLEYEDMFPFEGRLANLSARNAYTKDEVQQLLRWATDLQLQVIPLVQTFGHLEYVLKLPEFRHLRELQNFPQELCPSHPESLEMLRQVMALHAAAGAEPRFLHVGCDEVFHLNACGRCTARRLSPRALFAQHVATVARLVRVSFPGVTPLVWDDMLRSFAPDELLESELGRLVEPVVWVYGDSIASLVPHRVWHTYGRTFPRLWAAAAYRGASGPVAATPDLAARLRNVAAWRRRQLGGAAEPAPPPAALVLAGWARYDHFAVLCEPLPAAVPSLVLALLAARDAHPPRGDGDAGPLLERWRRRLGCDPRAAPFALDVHPLRLANCSFPGADAFAAVGWCERSLAEEAAALRDAWERRGWLSAYNVRRRFSSPSRALALLGGAAPAAVDLARARALLAHCRAATAGALSRYVDAHAVREWLEQRVAPLERRVAALEGEVLAVAAVDTWPRRPLD